MTANRTRTTSAGPWAARWNTSQGGRPVGLQIGATLYTSQKLYGPDDKDGTQLFMPGQEPFSVLGEAYAMLRLDDISAIRIGRQTFDLPWLARHDNRMVPNTFEAVAIGRRATTGLT